MGFKDPRRRNRATQPRLAEARGSRSGADRRTPRRRELTFVFVGAGYAGSKRLRSSLDLARDAVRHYPDEVRATPQHWVLVDAAPKILPEIPPRLGEYAAEQLERRGVDIRVNTTLGSDRATRSLALRRRPDPHQHGRLDDGGPCEPAAREVRPPARRLRARQGRRDLSRRRPATYLGARRLRSGAQPATPGRPDPPTSQHALRQARRLAKNLRGDPKPYRYRMIGQVATLGQHKGIAEVMGLKFRGFLGWWITRTYHLYQLPLLSKKLRVVTDWTVALFFKRDIAELSMLGHPKRLGDE